MKRDEEINKAYDKWQDDLECSERTVWQCACRWADENPKNPWVTDRMPEIKEGGWSDPVLLHVDGQFLKVSRYCRRKDGTTYWNGVQDWDGEEVDAWMPIPNLPTE